MGFLFLFVAVLNNPLPSGSCSRQLGGGGYQNPRPRIQFVEVNRSLGNGVRKNGVRNRVRIDDVGSILKFRIGFPFGENSAGFCQSVWLPGSILNFRIGSVSSIGGLIAATLFADTVSKIPGLI